LDASLPTIATEAVVHALPDGYTLLLVVQANAVNATLYDKCRALSAGDDEVRLLASVHHRLRFLTFAMGPSLSRNA
jgi:hypothetical protein